MTRKDKDLWEKFVSLYHDHVEDFDSELYNLKHKEATIINGEGTEAVFNYLIKEGGPSFVKDLLERVFRNYEPTRTLIIVEGVDIIRQSIFATIPAWNSRQIIIIPFEKIDKEVLWYILHSKEECRVFAEVTLGAAMKEELLFRAWSIK